MSDVHTFAGWVAAVLRLFADRLEHDPLLSHDTINETFREISVLHCQSQSDTIVHQLVNIAREGHKKMQTILEEKEPQPMALSPGGTVYLPPGEKRQSKFPYLHWCMWCLDVFRSRTQHPKRCGKCKSPLWKNTTKDARRIRKRTDDQE